MAGRDFTLAISVDRTPSEVFDAVNNVRGWWSGEITGAPDRLGAEFTYRYKDVHRSTQQVTEFEPERKTVWRVLDSHLGFVEDAAEWNGTEIVFEIAVRTGGTELRFTHRGLVPDIECYRGCSDAWGFYIRNSLRELITTGRGRPNALEFPGRA